MVSFLDCFYSAKAIYMARLNFSLVRNHNEEKLFRVDFKEI